MISRMVTSVYLYGLVRFDCWLLERIDYVFFFFIYILYNFYHLPWLLYDHLIFVIDIYSLLLYHVSCGASL